jgi:hypothetical protein
MEISENKKRIDFFIEEEIDVTHKPEEIVCQKFLCILNEEYGYPKESMSKEVAIYSGSLEVTDVVTNKPERADIVIYQNEIIYSSLKTKRYL